MANKKDRRRREVKHSRSRERRRLRRFRQKRKQKVSPKANGPRQNTYLVTAPKVFALEQEHHDEVASFLADLRDAVVDGKRPVCIDFRSTQMMVAGATLLLYSELLRIKQLYPHVVLRCLPAKQAVVGQILTHLKLYELLGYKSTVVPDRSDVVNWKVATSHRIDGSAIGRPLREFALDDLREKHLFRGASEAMVNAINHAYYAPRNDGMPSPPEKNWWMFFRRDNNKLIVAVCDLGIGIPRSLPLKYPSEVIHQAMSVLSAGRKTTDARMIQAAMELQRTRTSKRGRGKGLNDLRRIVDEVPGGALYLFSNRGLVKYAARSYTRRNFNRSIFGTVVVWIIPLGDGTDD